MAVLNNSLPNSPIESFIDIEKSIEDNIMNLNRKRTKQFLKNYREWLDIARSVVKKLVTERSLSGSQLLVILLVDIIYLLVLCDGSVLFTSERFNTQFIDAAVLLFSWYIYLCLSGMMLWLEFWELSRNFLLGISAIFFIRYKLKIRNLSTSGDIERFTYLKMLSIAGCCAAGGISFVSFSLTVTRSLGWNKYFIYFLNKPVTVVGWIVQLGTTICLLGHSWTTTTRAYRESQRNMDIGSKVKLKMISWISVLTAIASVISDIVVLSEQVHSSGSTRDWLGWINCVFYLFGMIAANILRPEIDASLYLVSLSLNFFSFWATNLTRIIINLLSLPVVALLSRKAYKDPIFENPLLISILSISISGFFDSISDGSIETSQRALKKNLIKGADSILFIPGAHEFFVKYSMCFFLYSIISVCKHRWTLLNELTIFFINSFTALPFAYQMARKEKLRHFYITFLTSNVLLSGCDLPLKLIRRLSQTLTGRLQDPLLHHAEQVIPQNDDGNEMIGEIDPDLEPIDRERNRGLPLNNAHGVGL
jgi:hypothetical protein